MADAEVVDVHIIPIGPVKFSNLQRYLALHPDEHWGYIESSDGRYYCVDGVPDSAGGELAEAIIYPELHTRLVSWWLTHAWRFVDLADEARTSLQRWNLTTAAVCSRALIEEVGCLLYESKKISAAWAEGKSTLPTEKRVEKIRNLLSGLLIQFAFGSRELIDIGLKPTTNVMTYVDKLVEESRQEGFREMYAWLSNAAHPAIGSKIAYSSPPLTHITGATALRRFSRRPTSLAGRSTDLEFLIAQHSSDATLAAAHIGLHACGNP